MPSNRPLLTFYTDDIQKRRLAWARVQYARAFGRPEYPTAEVLRLALDHALAAWEAHWGAPPFEFEVGSGTIDRNAKEGQARGRRGGSDGEGDPP